MCRNFLKGERGDKINAIFAAAAHNFLLLLGAIYLVAYFLGFFSHFFRLMAGYYCFGRTQFPDI
jgi:hypothetical protein